MSEIMLEKVAYAIWFARERRMPARTRRKPDEIDKATGAWPYVLAEARAAIEAMRTPTEPMMEAAFQSDLENPQETWEDMIDAALCGTDMGQKQREQTQIHVNEHDEKAQ